MKTYLAVLLLALVGLGSPVLGQGDPAGLAPTGKLRAAFLATNPAQAMRNASTGEFEGPSIDLARALATRLGRPLELAPLQSPPAIIEALGSGAADIGFVAYEATRRASVDFSDAYMLVQQTFLVLDGAPIRSIADLDRAASTKVGGTANDSVTLCLRRTLKQAQLVELENNPAVLAKAMADRTVDAFGANRQRLTTLMASVPGTRILEDTFFSVPQNIAIAKGRPDALAALNTFLDDQRTSGALGTAVGRSRAVGVAVAPKQDVSTFGCPQ